MANGPGPRRPETIHVLPEEMMDLEIDAKIVHMARMLDGYLYRLFTHTYGIEYILKDDERGLSPRVRSMEEYQSELRRADAIGQVVWVRERRRFEGKILAAVVTGLVINAVGLAIVAVATFRIVGG